MRCVSCAVDLASVEERTAHYRAEFHRYNVKRRCANLPPIDEPTFLAQLAQLAKASGGKASRSDAQRQQQQQQQSVFHCGLCRKSFKSESLHEQHLRSKKHRKKEASQRAQEKLSSGTVQRVVSATRPDTSADASADASEVDGDVNVVEEGAEDGGEYDDDDDDDMEFDEDDAEAIAAMALKQPIPLNTCLFCPRQFSSLKPALDHMLSEHGFFLPYAEYLVDVEGLVEYLGAKIGQGNMCIYCNATFHSTHAVQQHMGAKSHCKLNLDSEDAVEEYLDGFYEFPGEATDEDDMHDTEEDEDDGADDGEDDGEHKTSAAMVLVDDGSRAVQKQQQQQQQSSAKSHSGKRHVESMSEGGELVLSDGSVIGHRSLRRYYKQSLRPVETRDHQLIQSMIKEYKLLKLPGYERSQAQARKRQVAAIVRKVNKQRMRLGIRHNKVLQHHRRLQVVF
eukprot:TRINITY_DN66434_c8_g1_i1.p1 TRINITY_DN66434_c8_g1~~TRINITY_DN66434_c8_g1_i1.p1  ORF type:complete len:480 (+),score=259.99 TRINITY_DN66434_c8_g1_i1:89-1441(+)